MMKNSPARHSFVRRALLVIAVSTVLSACTHSDESSEKKSPTLNPSASVQPQQVNKKTQAKDNNLVPYFNRPPVGTPIETH